MIKIMKYGDVSPEEIFARGKTSFDVGDTVAEIIENVKQNGDKALFEYCEKFDKAQLSSLEVSAEEIEEAFSLVEPRFIEILKEAKKIALNFEILEAVKRLENIYEILVSYGVEKYYAAESESDDAPVQG